MSNEFIGSNIGVVPYCDAKVCYHDANMPPLKYIEDGCWIDLRVVEIFDRDFNSLTGKDWTSYTFKTQPRQFEYIDKYNMVKLSLGVTIVPPEGYESIIAPRGSTFQKYGLIQTNSIGVVDDTFVGPDDVWTFPAYTLSKGIISKYDRVCQFRFQKKMPLINFKSVNKEDLNTKSRGMYGSTGRNEYE